eukprot:7759820-Karenia_brevis.AAC.1
MSHRSIHAYKSAGAWVTSATEIGECKDMKEVRHLIYRAHVEHMADTDNKDAFTKVVDRAFATADVQWKRLNDKEYDQQVKDTKKKKGAAKASGSRAYRSRSPSRRRLSASSKAEPESEHEDAES